MTRAFDLTADPDELRELLDVTARSIFTYVDETIEGIQAQIDWSASSPAARTPTDWRRST